MTTAAARPLAMTAFCIASSLGVGRAATLAALRQGSSGLASCRFETVDLLTYVGAVPGLEDADTALGHFDCRNNRLARLALSQDGFEGATEAAKARYGAGRIGVFLGTSTSGILQTEQAYRRRDPVSGRLPGDFSYAGTQSTFSLADFVMQTLGLQGPGFVVSSACASTTKVFATATRMIETGMCDAAVVGGADSLCLTTLYGFNALQLLADGPCRPFDARRGGLSIGEAAGFALLERSDKAHAAALHVLGVGESSDAHHMSAPHPDGLGARLAIEQALARAGRGAADIQYINLHGTATPKNDAVEARVVAHLFPGTTRASSTKGWTGHTLGAAGALEAIISLLSLRTGLMPGTLNTQQLDVECGPQIRLDNAQGEVRCALSNSFGFGGSNCALLFGREAA
jgi:3-oxoacyl-[acyl-carrier-protein] synthase I